MIVEVSEAVCIVRCVNRPYTTTGYRQMECIQGCGLEEFYRGHKYTTALNINNLYRAVLCSLCLSIRHLNKFEEYNI